MGDALGRPTTGLVVRPVGTLVLRGAVMDSLALAACMRSQATTGGAKLLQARNSWLRINIIEFNIRREYLMTYQWIALVIWILLREELVLQR